MIVWRILFLTYLSRFEIPFTAHHRVNINFLFFFHNKSDKSAMRLNAKGSGECWCFVWRKHRPLCWEPAPRKQSFEVMRITSLTQTRMHAQTHACTHCIWAGQWFVHINHALNGPWSRLGWVGSVSTQWIAKQIQLRLPVININNRLTLFFYILNFIFPRHDKWIAAIPPQLV